MRAPAVSSGSQVRAPAVSGGAAVRSAPITGGAGINAPNTTAGAAVNAPQVTSGARINAPGTTAGAGVNVPQVTGNTAVRSGTASGITAGGINAGANTGGAINAGANTAGINTGANTGAAAHTALKPTIGAAANTGAAANAGAAANVGANAASNFRANWHNATTATLPKVNTNLSSAVKAAAPAATAQTAANIGANTAANTAAATAGANTAAATGVGAAANTAANANLGAAAGINNFATINPVRANFWSSLGQGMVNNALFGNPYGPFAYGAYGPYAYGAYGGYGGYPYFGGNFWSGRNLVGLGVMSGLGGGGYGGYGVGGYGGMGNWWGYSPWLGYQPYSYWYGNPGWGTFANYYGWNQPFFYDYGPNGNVVYQGSQVLVNDQPVGTAEQYAQSAAELAQITPEQMNAPHDWMPLGTFAVATGQNDKNPVRTAQLAYDNKQGLISGTIFNKESGNLYTLQGKVDPQTQRVAFTIGKDPNTVMETGLYNLTQNTTPVLVHFGPTQTATYVFARLPEPKEGEQSAATATAPANTGAPAAEDLRR